MPLALDDDDDDEAKKWYPLRTRSETNNVRYGLRKGSSDNKDRWDDYTQLGLFPTNLSESSQMLGTECSTDYKCFSLDIQEIVTQELSNPLVQPHLMCILESTKAGAVNQQSQLWKWKVGSGNVKKSQGSND
ncbi:hypothetical protein CROQUDRAFT_97168 [Cronartium quercuum f. sp. fusiforme G11]|uniref:Uncharacterized protein n=1 Tax=Cronartium quercuum f. sp. fusiforme G11 TaxID=708437 RepID=A0A9P6NA12_9BASI|nr:hypothetical protein CROQUDRAFT_97168 [Cronartium quercuum f. sp. fusiforme G11]